MIKQSLDMLDRPQVVRLGLRESRLGGDDVREGLLEHRRRHGVGAVRPRVLFLAGLMSELVVIKG